MRKLKASKIKAGGPNDDVVAVLNEHMDEKYTCLFEGGNLDVRSIARTHPASQLYLEERQEAATADLKDLKFIIDENETSGAVAHLCVYQDERTEWVYIPENTGKLVKYRTCKAAHPGKKGHEIIEC